MPVIEVRWGTVIGVDSQEFYHVGPYAELSTLDFILKNIKELRKDLKRGSDMDMAILERPIIKSQWKKSDSIASMLLINSAQRMREVTS